LATGIAKLILVGFGAVGLLLGSNWFFERTLPLQEIGIPPFVASIILGCAVILIITSAWEKRFFRQCERGFEREVADEKRLRALTQELWSGPLSEATIAANELARIGSPGAVKHSTRHSIWSTNAVGFAPPWAKLLSASALGL
jgi:hypothetical protein